MSYRFDWTLRKLNLGVSRMKLKIWLIITLALTLLTTVSLSAFASGITINQAISSSTTDPNYPASYLIDEKESTFWQLRNNVKQGWARLMLAQPSLIYGLKIKGSLGTDTELAVEYQANGEWLPFTAAKFRTLTGNDEEIDLSWDRIVTQAIRLKLISKSIVSGYITGIELMGEPGPSIFHQLRIKNIIPDHNASPSSPAYFLKELHRVWQTAN